MKGIVAALGAIALLALALGGCGDGGALQAVVFDEFGYALYRFDKDEGSTSTCYGACAKQWAPLLTEGTPIAYAAGNEKYPTGKVPDNGIEAFGSTWHAMHRTGQGVKQQGA